MARARNLKPGFFRDAALVELPIETRLLFPGLWTLADREGRLEDKPKQIKMEIYPADSFDIEAMLEQLHKANLIQRYEVEGKKYIQVVNFTKHQNPHKDEKASTIPAPCEPGANTVQTPIRDGGNPADSLNPQPSTLNKPTADKPPRFDAMTMPLPEDLEVEVWQTWVKYRKALKGKQPVQLTWEAQANNLATWQKDGHDPRAIIKNSIDNGYQGLFEPKRNGGKSNADSRADVIAAFTGRRRESTLQGAIEGDYRTVESS